MTGSAGRIMIVAGEASGDLHGAGLAAALLRRRPGIELFGMGGALMRREGVETLVDISRVAVVGLWEVLAHFGDIKGAFDAMKKALADRRPSLLVLIDYPDFNLRLAKVAARLGVPVVYYISPQVWAWRRGRVTTMARLVRRMLVVFPFEEKFYRDAGVDCRFVGNPLMDEAAEQRPRAELAAKFGLDPGRPVLGLLPGSRRTEIHYHLEVMLESFRRLRERIEGLQGVIPVAPTLTREVFEAALVPGDDVCLVEGDTAGVMEVMDAGLVASGTATLQTAVHGKPMVIIYRLSPLTYAIGRLLVRVPHIGMANIVAGREVVPELVQGTAVPERIVPLLARLFEDPEHYRATVAGLAEVRRRLGEPGASDRAAEAVLELF